MIPVVGNVIELDDFEEIVDAVGAVGDFVIRAELVRLAAIAEPARELRHRIGESIVGHFRARANHLPARAQPLERAIRRTGPRPVIRGIRVRTIETRSDVNLVAATRSAPPEPNLVRSEHRPLILPLGHEDRLHLRPRRCGLRRVSRVHVATRRPNVPHDAVRRDFVRPLEVAAALDDPPRVRFVQQGRVLASADVVRSACSVTLERPSTAVPRGYADGKRVACSLRHQPAPSSAVSTCPDVLPAAPAPS